MIGDYKAFIAFSYAVVCMHCGVLVARDDQETHTNWHLDQGEIDTYILDLEFG